MRAFARARGTLGRATAQSKDRRLTVKLELADQGEGVEPLLLIRQGNENGMLTRTGTRLMVQHRPSRTGCVGGIGYGQNPAFVVMDHVDVEHLRIPVQRACAA